MSTRCVGNMVVVVLVVSFAVLVSCARTGGDETAGGDKQAGEAAAEPSAGIDAKALVGSWKLESFEGDGQSEPTVADGDITLQFGEDSAVGGSSGCNNYRTTFGLGENDSVQFGAMASTRMACRTEIMDQEQRYQKIMESASALRLEGDELAVLDADHEVVLRFGRMKQEQEAGD